MKIEFRYQLLIAFSVVTALALTATVLLSWQTATTTVRENTDKTLTVAEKVLEEIIRESNRQLRERAKILAEDFGFRRAIATGEQQTIISVLANHGARVDADMMFLLDPKGQVTETTHDLGDQQQRNSLIRGEMSRLLFSENNIYQVAVVPIRAPDLIGWVGMGAVIDNELTENLKRLSLTDVSLLFADQDGGTRTISTLNNISRGEFSDTGLASATEMLITRLQDQNMLSHQFALEELNDVSLQVVLSSSLTTALDNWKPWQRQLWLIGLLSLLVTGFTAWQIARSVTRPIATLVAAANDIAAGDYSTAINVDARNEFGFLADTMNHMEAAISEREARILHQARYDELTDLPNRQHLNEHILERSSAHSVEGYSTLAIQVNKYQNLNEAYGMDWCDQLLCQLADLLKTQLGADDRVARIGRDQFLMYCDSGDKASAVALANNIVNALEAPVICGGIEVKIDLRIGAALSPKDGDQPDIMIRRSAIAMARAGLGIEGVTFYEEGQDLKLMRQLRVTQRLQQAIEGDGLSLHYQPKFDLHRNRVTQAEALLRWTDAELGKVFPDEFIPLAESSGDIHALSDWVMAEAARCAAHWRELGIDLQIAVNVSGRDFQQPDFVERNLETIAAAGAEPEQLVLEVTESATIDDSEQAVAHLNQLREAGFTLAIDDFGTGFSSLSQLKLLPVHELKIDKCFVMALDSDADDHKIVRSTIELGHNLGLSVLAEGVESHTSLLLLRQMGCDAIQGYHLSRPMSQDEFERWWRDHDSHIAHAISSPSG